MSKMHNIECFRGVPHGMMESRGWPRREATTPLPVTGHQVSLQMMQHSVNNVPQPSYQVHDRWQPMAALAVKLVFLSDLGIMHIIIRNKPPLLAFFCY